MTALVCDAFGSYLRCEYEPKLTQIATVMPTDSEAGGLSADYTE